ncbi:MAG: C40 family peptidase [Ginsengibacter sp.]
MNKLNMLYIVLLLTGPVQLCTAQTSVNKIRITAGSENTSPNFINGIAFTPDGILQTTESGGTKSVKTDVTPIVVKNKENANISSKESNTFIEKLSRMQFKYAMMLDVDVESLKNLSLFGFIENWFGTRYRMGGTTKKGIDCSAFTSTLLMAVYGFSLPRTAKDQYHATDHINKDNLKEGDLVFFNTRGGISHVGLYLDNNYFVHSSSKQGVTISSLEDGYYERKFICGGRVIK